MAGSSDSSPYDTAKGNIRDTVKWLAAALSSLAAVVVGGTSFSGIGAIPVFSSRFIVAVVALLTGFACVGLALYRTLRLLRSDGLFVSDLLGRDAAGDDRELRQVRNEIDRHKGELLPLNYPTVAQLLRASSQQQQAMENAIKDRDDAAFQESKRRFDELEVPIARVLDFAVYSRMYHRMENELLPLFLIATGALVALLAFATAVADQKPAETSPPSNTVIFERSCEHSCRKPDTTATQASNSTSQPLCSEK